MYHSLLSGKLHWNEKNNFKLQNVMVAIKTVQTFSNECIGIWIKSISKAPTLKTIWPTIACEKKYYSRWQHPGHLKTGTNVFEIDLIQIPIHSLEKVCTVLIATITFCSLTLFFSFQWSFPESKERYIKFVVA